MKRCPSFSSRPSFPKDLQILLLDAESPEGPEAILKECGFCPSVCRTSADAIQRLVNPVPGQAKIDLLLVDAACLSKKTAENTALLSWAKEIPMVLMTSSSKQVISGITKQGAGESSHVMVNLLT